MEYIVIGEVLRPQGIKGEVKVKALTGDPERYEQLKTVYIDGKPYRICGMRFNGGAVFLRFSGVEDRDAAELLRGKQLMIDRVNAVARDEGEYFITDIVGLDVVDEMGEHLGKIYEVLQFGAADVVCCRNAKTEFRFPFLLRVVQKVDLENGKFCVLREKLNEVCVYDD